MALTDTPEIPLKSSSSPPREYKSSIVPLVDGILRVLLFATALASIIVMVTSKQTKMVPVAPGITVPLKAEFKQSPAFVYFVAALSVACLYSIITGLLSVLGLIKAGGISTKMQFHFVTFDALLLGIVVAATGAAGAVAYIGLKGNSHSRWNKICNTFDSFCFHIASSVLLSLISSIILLLLVWLTVFVLSKKISRH